MYFQNRPNIASSPSVPRGIFANLKGSKPRTSNVRKVPDSKSSDEWSTKTNTLMEGELTDPEELEETEDEWTDIETMEESSLMASLDQVVVQSSKCESRYSSDYPPVEQLRCANTPNKNTLKCASQFKNGPVAASTPITLASIEDERGSFSDYPPVEQLRGANNQNKNLDCSWFQSAIGQLITHERLPSIDSDFETFHWNNPVASSTLLPEPPLVENEWDDIQCSDVGEPVASLTPIYPEATYIEDNEIPPALTPSNESELENEIPNASFEKCVPVADFPSPLITPTEISIGILKELPSQAEMRSNTVSPAKLEFEEPPPKAEVYNETFKSSPKDKNLKKKVFKSKPINEEINNLKYSSKARKTTTEELNQKKTSFKALHNRRSHPAETSESFENYTPATTATTPEKNPKLRRSSKKKLYNSNVCNNSRSLKCTSKVKKASAAKSNLIKEVPLCPLGRNLVDGPLPPLLPSPTEDSDIPLDVLHYCMVKPKSDAYKSNGSKKKMSSPKV